MISDLATNVTTIVRHRYATKAYAPEHLLVDETLYQLFELLRLSPSSVNIQPWHFMVAGAKAARARIAKSTAADGPYNTNKILDASHVIVLCVRADLDDAYLRRLLTQEDTNGRFTTPEAGLRQDKRRRFYVELHRKQRDVRAWTEKQVYLALGVLLLGAASLGVDATPIEGFDSTVLDKELGLPERGLHSLVLVTLGRRAKDDFNAVLPKSRLPQEEIFTFL